MLSVTQLARKYRISRTCVLYYEREGLIQPERSENGYRWYGKELEKKLETILAYRSYGVPVADIRSLLSRETIKTQEEILRDRFSHLEIEIQNLRNQQSAIVALLKQPQLMEDKMVTKKRWVEIMEAAGFSEEDMRNWHRQFEKMEPEEHQTFLESLGIKPDEIKKIRNL